MQIKYRLRIIEHRTRTLFERFSRRNYTSELPVQGLQAFVKLEEYRFTVQKSLSSIIHQMVVVSKMFAREQEKM